MRTGRGLATPVNMDNIQSIQCEPFIILYLNNHPRKGYCSTVQYQYSEILITALPGTISPGSQLTPNHTHPPLSVATVVNINVDYVWWTLESDSCQL